MNILFLLRSLDLGGLEVVTAVLANKFAIEGHHVFVFAFEERSGKVRCRFDSNIIIYTCSRYQFSTNNIRSLRTLLEKERIDIVINQWGLPIIPIEVLSKARKGIELRVISVYHNDPLKNSRIQDIDNNISKADNILLKAVLITKKFLLRIITGYSMRNVYRHSDVFEVLSPSYIEHFKDFTKVKDLSRLVVMPNPVTLNNEGFLYKQSQKEKEIIYIGRVEYTQKRTHRVIETWTHIEHYFSDWRLTIVGDGDDRENLESMVENMKLQRVHFEGFQFPRPYYERASILLLTSDFEGFPLVLTECMSFGVIPVVYGSFPAVYDILENGKDGIIVPKTELEFSPSLMAKVIRQLLANPQKRNEMALCAIEKSKRYSIDSIYKQWTEVFKKIAG